jgi:hypothetical protein
MLFTYQILEQEYSLAFVIPFIPVYSHQNRLLKDKDLEFLRIWEDLPSNIELISIHSILHGVVAIPARDDTTD